MSAPQSLPHPEDRSRKITMVKKLLLSGEPCAKCAQAEEMLRGRGVWDQIDEVVWAKEGDSESPGAQLAQKYGVDVAPFFVIERPGQKDEIVESTLKLIKLAKEPPSSGSSVSTRSAAAGAASSASAVASDRAAPAASPATVGAPPPAAPAPDAAEIAEAARELRDKSPQEILAWGLARYGANCALAFSGAEDVVLIDMALRTGLPFSAFCLDTGRLHEETYRFIDRVRAFYGVDIQVMFP
ncbi:MAG TPA: phosphoadenosine phosphosulfate reductase family protein, partial [Polyangiaceae bacterium]|nr:phosphoadenosine phosphosulfate reductase family protein [Polyangiaceae bacterium]